MQAKTRKRQRSLRFVGEALAALMVLVLVALIGPASASPLDQAMDKVFTVRSADDEDRFLGSAFLWADGSVAVTNAHVVGSAEEVRLIDRHGTDRQRSGQASHGSRHEPETGSQAFPIFEKQWFQLVSITVRPSEATKPG